MEKQLTGIRKAYHQNYVKLKTNASEATGTNPKKNLQPSAKGNQINQMKTNYQKSSDKSNFSKKSNQIIEAHTWLKGSPLVIRDSTLEGLDERKMSSKRVVKISGGYHR